ncbi:MAG TPA: LytTR family DNA-binding domain-containing protein, partial [Chitinophagaceae bacterium]|nr:LytTR family DNA-binding domain-containing protein [Chitinophagaceae bacterium]
MKIPIGIVDDKSQNRISLAERINYSDDIEVVLTAKDGNDFLEQMKRLHHSAHPSVILMDIEMPGMNGFEMLQKLPSINFSVIFTTSYDQYAIKAIRFSALDYLLKPVDREELQIAVQKAIHKSHETFPQQIEMLLNKLQHPFSAINKIAIPTMEGLQMIPVNLIISGASSSNYTILSLKNKEKITASKTLKEIEELLEDFCFLRVHHSFIVNINEVEKYVKG